ncbi:MAG TPA: hypothetical protein VGA85_00925 [Dehalococcoidales bacterium]
MVDWQITATTLVCNAVAEEVTVLVYPDWTVRCTGFEKYSKSREASLVLLKRSLKLRETLDCKGLDCPTIIEYKLKLEDEEKRRASHAGEKK